MSIGLESVGNTAAISWGADGYDALDAAVTTHCDRRVDVTIASDVFHSGGASTALPFLHTVQRVCSKWGCTRVIVVSSFRSDDTTALITEVCRDVGLARSVVDDSLNNDALPASQRRLVEIFT